MAMVYGTCLAGPWLVKGISWVFNIWEDLCEESKTLNRLCFNVLIKIKNL